MPDRPAPTMRTSTVRSSSPGTHAYQNKHHHGHAARTATIDRPCGYPIDSFSDAERSLLSAHCTNLDRPVFALINLPETLRAPCSRATRAIPARSGACCWMNSPATSRPCRRRERSARRGRPRGWLYERIFLGYGDDSVAQLGGAHVACEWVSNVLTKVLQRPRLAAYLEQSTRYIAYDSPDAGAAPPMLSLLPRCRSGTGYGRAMDELFGTYAAAMPRVIAWAADRYSPLAPRSPRPPTRAPEGQGTRPLARAAARRLAVAHGHLCERSDLRAADPAPARPPAARGTQLWAMILEELQAVMPSFLTRVQRPDRGGALGLLSRVPRAGRRALGEPAGIAGDRTRRSVRRSAARSPRR